MLPSLPAAFHSGAPTLLLPRRELPGLVGHIQRGIVSPIARVRFLPPVPPPPGAASLLLLRRKVSGLHADMAASGIAGGAGSFLVASPTSRGAKSSLLVEAAAKISPLVTSSLAASQSKDDVSTSPAILAAKGLLFRQLFESLSCTYTYILADSTCSAKPGLIIDPVECTAERDAAVLQELGIDLLYGLNTHVHADHITGTARLKGFFPNMKTVISKASGARADVHIKHGDVISFGRFSLEVRATPGHTNGCVTYVVRGPPEALLSPTTSLDAASAVGTPEEPSSVQGGTPAAAASKPAGSGAAGPELMAFTGDALLIRGCGRTDFQQGNARLLYKSVHSQILSLPPATPLFPAHDYKGRTATTVAEELQWNLRLTKSEEEFKDIMDNLGLPYPKQFDVAVPANLVCGYHEDVLSGAPKAL